MATAEPVTVPDGYLDIAGLDDVTYRELTERRAWLLDVIASAGPGANHHGVRTAALVLPAIINELDTRARTYAKAATQPEPPPCTSRSPFTPYSAIATRVPVLRAGRR